jgi:predicted nucleotidyltransferase
MPPSPDGIADLPSEDCQLRGIARLEAFGSIARGEARRGSDVDLLAPFASNPGLSFYSMEDGMASFLGAPEHLLMRDCVDHMTNPYRRRSILADSTVICHG